jgi:hypothetical protein
MEEDAEETPAAAKDATRETTPETTPETAAAADVSSGPPAAPTPAPDTGADSPEKTRKPVTFEKKVPAAPAEPETREEPRAPAAPIVPGPSAESLVLETPKEPRRPGSFAETSFGDIFPEYETRGIFESGGAPETPKEPETIPPYAANVPGEEVPVSAEEPGEQPAPQPLEPPEEHPILPYVGHPINPHAERLPDEVTAPNVSSLSPGVPVTETVSAISLQEETVGEPALPPPLATDPTSLPPSPLSPLPPFPLLPTDPLYPGDRTSSPETARDAGFGFPPGQPPDEGTIPPLFVQEPETGPDPRPRPVAPGLQRGPSPFGNAPLLPQMTPKAPKTGHLGEEKDIPTIDGKKIVFLGVLVFALAILSFAGAALVYFGVAAKGNPLVSEAFQNLVSLLAIAFLTGSATVIARQLANAQKLLKNLERLLRNRERD